MIDMLKAENTRLFQNLDAMNKELDDKDVSKLII